MDKVRNTSQDPEYEGLPYHEKKFHKTHFPADWKSSSLAKRKNGDTKRMNGTLYVWRDGKWKPA